MKPDAEAINAEAKLVMGRIIARRIATDPATVDRAKAWYAEWSAEDRASKPAIFWIEALEQGPEAVRRRLAARDERAYWMRNSMPLALSDGLDCLRDVDFRRRIWRDAKRLVAMRIRRVLKGYSEGGLSRDDAVRLLGLRDYAELLVALGDADQPMPMPPNEEIERQAKVVEKLWRGQRRK
ncbi:MAG TPA: hypothetical protein VGO06_00605 [Bosea sp. (in: a-proteobacteria)]|uniref:hypothetical protein n=1 Tax=Bosea sp. (in: a-proteobacteria) TaxID=1871050 RepID=UPI002E137841|nr:hypothetical protein [Bosea sp. (in: a-proteobacteria)]